MVAAGVAALCGGIYAVGRLTAQQPQPGAPAQPAARPSTRIGLINLTYVIKNYNKFKAFQDEMKGQLKGYEEKDKDFAKQAELWAKKLSDPTATPADKENAEKYITELQRKREDNSKDAKAALSKKSDEQMVILYKEVQDAAQRTAVGHSCEMVLHYNDATEQADYWSPGNVLRKMQAGSCFPLYAMPGMDISVEVAQTLNASYRPAAPAAPPAGGAAPAGQPRPQP
jgi:Skp family chaperone for outer membrane proteins